MAVVLAVGVLYQTFNPSAAWSLPSFVLRSSSSLSAIRHEQPFALERPKIALVGLTPAPSPSEINWKLRQHSIVQNVLQTPSVHSPEGVTDLHHQHDNMTVNSTELGQAPSLSSVGFLDDKNRTISEEEQGRLITAAKADEIESAPMSAPAAELEMNVGIPRTESSILSWTSEKQNSSDGDDNSSSNRTMEEGVQPKNSSAMASAPVPVNDMGDLLLTSAAEKQPKWTLSQLEHVLQAAKQAIADAQPLLNASSDFDKLYAPIYHNLSQFKKSYELMEQIFRVYVYEEGSKPLVHTGPLEGIYSAEGLFIRGMKEDHQFVVKNPAEAHAFFLPYSVANMVTELYVPDSHTMLPIATFIKEYVELIAAKHPFWNRTKGGDHFFVACHDWGPATARDHKELHENTMEVVCNADKNEGFKQGKDASLPEFYSHNAHKLPSEMDVGGPGPSKRQEILAFFAGQMHGRVRPKLLQHWRWPLGGPHMEIYEVLPAAEARQRSYERRMKSSRYCICAAGYEVNSPRIVESILADCVPVIVADGFILPFAHVLNWSAFSVRIAEADIPALKDILEAIPEKRYRSMQRRLRHVRGHFLWHRPPRRFDTFHMILHSVWTNRLLQV